VTLPEPEASLNVDVFLLSRFIFVGAENPGGKVLNSAAAEEEEEEDVRGLFPPPPTVLDLFQSFTSRERRIATDINSSNGSVLTGHTAVSPAPSFCFFPLIFVRLCFCTSVCV